MDNEAEYRLLMAQIANEKTIIEAMENSSYTNPKELENHKRILKGLLLEKEERDKKWTSSN